jgi:hypothetical protein
MIRQRKSILTWRVFVFANVALFIFICAHLDSVLGGIRLGPSHNDRLANQQANTASEVPLSWSSKEQCATGVGAGTRMFANNYLLDKHLTTIPGEPFPMAMPSSCEYNLVQESRRWANTGVIIFLQWN